jgi:hypothetical protein
MTGYIYKITNNINDKVYIGLATTTIEERFATHKKDAFKVVNEKRPLYSAMRKYGVEHFFIELIEECDINILADREVYWIAHYNSYHNGYNATLGGDGKPLYDYEAILTRLQEHPYPCDVAKEFGCCVDIPREIAKKNNIPVKDLAIARTVERLSQEISAFNKKTKTFERTFSSAAEAARWCVENKYAMTLNGGVRSHICECANGQRTSAYGFIWKYTKDLNLDK